MERISGGFPGFPVPVSAGLPAIPSGLYARHKIGFGAELARRPIEPGESAYSGSSIGFSAPLRGAS